ncbi:MAG: glycosyltransferase family 9 protein [Bacteroidetes bacterium]|nr:glycosyltransferase family 9 protein [Bacteroidota bacterium]
MKHILILKVGAIGDVVMLLPLITEIRKKNPHAKITWLCGKQVLPILQNVEGIDELIPVDETRLLKKSIFHQLSEILRVWTKVGFRSFDLQLFFYHSYLYRVLTLPAFFKETKGFRDNKTGSRLPVPGRHHSKEYIRAFLGEGGAVGIAPVYPTFRPNATKIKKQNAIKKIVLACGGARNILQNNDLRRWPLTHYQSLAEKINTAGYEIILTGTEGDAWVKKGFEGIPHTDLIGKQNLGELLDTLFDADMLITHDSGPLHLADLVNCPVLGLFGPTMPSEKHSLQHHSAFIWGGEHLSCRPCYDGKDYGNCSSNECLQSISPDRVFSKMKEMLA